MDNKLRTIRLSRGMSIRGLEKLSGVTRPTIIKLERGEYTRPRIVTMFKLAEALGVDVQAILEENVCYN